MFQILSYHFSRPIVPQPNGGSKSVRMGQGQQPAGPVPMHSATSTAPETKSSPANKLEQGQQPAGLATTQTDPEAPTR